MPNAVTARPVCEEVRALLRAGEKACWYGGLAIVAVLGIAASTSSFDASGSSWWATTIALIVAAVGAVTTIRAGTAHFRCVVTDVSGWQVSRLLLASGAATALLAWGAAYVTVEALDAFIDDFGSKTEQQALRAVFAATFWAGAGVAFMLASLILQIGHALPAARQRAAFVALVMVLVVIALPIGSA